MVKKLKQVHHRHIFVGALGAVGLLTLTAQAASASEVTVKPGDTVWGIAQQHGLTTQAIEAANPTTVKKISNSVDLIQVGQRLTLPDGQTTVAQRQTNSGQTMYTVQTGDRLANIAQRFGVRSDQLRQWNQLTDSQLVAGQQLRISAPITVQPNMTSPATAGSGSTVNQNNVTAIGIQSESTVISQPTTMARTAAAMATNSTTQFQPAPGQENAQQVASPITTPVQSTNINGSSVPSSYSDGSIVETSSTGGQPVSGNQSVVEATGGQQATSAPTTVPDQVIANQQPAGTNQSTTEQQQGTDVQSGSLSQPTEQTGANNSVTGAEQETGTSNTETANLQAGSVVSLATKIATSNSVPYVWGGNSLSGMDCSGFVDYVYAHAENKQLPHNSVALESYVNQHAVSQAQPGDLLFWGQHGSTYHVAIYTGNNQYAAAAKPGTNVSIYTLSPYFTPSFAGTVK